METTLILFLETFFDAGEAKFEAGKHYPATEETERFVPTIARRVTVDLSAEKAQKLAEKARAAADKAAAAAAEAEQLAKAAQEAQQQAADALAALEMTAEVQTSAQPEVPPVVDPVPPIVAVVPPGGESAVAGPVGGAEQSAT